MPFKKTAVGGAAEGDRGKGALEDFAAALDAGADALLAASVFHFGIHRIGDVKSYLAKHNYPVRTNTIG